MLKTTHMSSEWIPAMQLVVPAVEGYLWPIASIAQTTTVWLLTTVTVLRYYVISQSTRLRRIRIKKAPTHRIVAVIVVSAIAFNIPR